MFLTHNLVFMTFKQVIIQVGEELEGSIQVRTGVGEKTVLCPTQYVQDVWVTFFAHACEEKVSNSWTTWFDKQTSKSCFWIVSVCIEHSGKLVKQSETKMSLTFVSICDFSTHLFRYWSDFESKLWSLSGAVITRRLLLHAIELE